VVAEPGDWAVLRSPAGQLFCAVPWEGQATRPDAAVGPSGTASRVDQLCLDIPSHTFDAEVAFWSTVTGWPARATDLAEFRRLTPPATIPVRVLCQRLGDGPASVHLDLRCDDVDATRAWHEQLGATAMGRHLSWWVMRDPAGGAYCLIQD
jgi:hypothetical protein